jgi:EmrB/QacA subfamily drug resistance transporter
MSIMEGAPAVVAQDASEAVDEPRFSRRVTWLTMLSVLLVMLLSSLDQTIVGTAMPRVIAELHGFDRYTWVTTAYLLTSTVMIPIYGKLSDIFGRKPILIFALSVFLIGSGLSGASQTMTQLILFRAIQGIGAGGLMSTAIAVVGDLFAPRERAKWQGVIGGVFGVAFILGPTVGGWITDNSTWRWVFYVNLPLGIIALLVLIFLMPVLRQPNKHARIDFIGAALLVVGTVPLLLGFSWAGSQYAWGSPQVIGMLITAAAGWIAFVLYELRLERTGGQPIIEPTLFKNNTFAVSTLVTMITGVALFGSIFYIPLFVQGVIGTSATNSGVIMTPMMLTAIITSVVSGQIVARTGRYKILAIVGACISLIGGLLLLRLGIDSTNTDVVVAMVVLGLGMGTGMSLFNLLVQNALPNKIGQATAALTFFRQIGSTIGLAGMGAVMNSIFPDAFKNALPDAVKAVIPASALQQFNNPQILLSPDAQAQLHQTFAAFGPQGLMLLNELLDAVKMAMVQGVHGIFLLSAGLTILSIITLFFLKEIPLRGGRRREEPVVEVVEESLAEESGLALVD